MKIKISLSGLTSKFKENTWYEGKLLVEYKGKPKGSSIFWQMREIPRAGVFTQLCDGEKWFTTLESLNQAKILTVLVPKRDISGNWAIVNDYKSALLTKTVNALSSKRGVSISKYGPGTYTEEAGLYSAVEPTENSVKKIIELAKAAGFEDLEPDLHCTVMYSPTAAIPEDVATEYSQPFYNAIPLEFKWWEGHDKDGYLVLALKSPLLAKEHQRLKEAGCVPTFDDYIPHITLKNKFYFESEDDQKSKLRYANLILRRSVVGLTLTKQKVEDIK
jgi:hypothetical protein